MGKLTSVREVRSKSALQMRNINMAVFVIDPEAPLIYKSDGTGRSELRSAVFY